MKIELKIENGCLFCYTSAPFIKVHGKQPGGYSADWYSNPYSGKKSFQIKLDQLSCIRFGRCNSFQKYLKHCDYDLFFIEKPLDICSLSVSDVSADSMMEIDGFCKKNGIKFVDIDNEPFLVPYDGYGEQWSF